ncbi:MAG: hypothetical protein GKR87_16385 [Kiritimatiellae bacterium]|nr:hypothetical protein [Kiritimatiellia bacterium]
MKKTILVLKNLNVKTHCKCMPHFLAFRVMLLGGLLILLGCQSITQSYPKGKTYMFFDEWWDYYQRGLAAQHANQYQTAGKYFEICLGLRPGATYPYTQDIRRARTYGLHLIDGYFPHRELGISLYYQGYLQEALDYLVISLEQEDSERAHYYINKTRKTSLQGRRFPTPTFTFSTYHGPLFWTANRQEMLRGQAVSEGYVETIQIDDIPIPLVHKLAEQTKAFQAEIKLHEGTNVVSVKAIDLAGNTATTQIVWMADFHPPQIHIEHLIKRTGGYDLTILCQDHQALSHVTLNGDRVFEARPLSTRRLHRLTTQIDLGKSITLHVQDRAGNSLQKDFSPEVLEKLASNPMPLQYVTANEPGIPDVDPRHAHSTAANRLYLSLSQTKIGTVDKEEYYVDGWARHPVGVERIQITANDQELMSGDLAPPYTYFSGRVPLKLGTNYIEVTARSAEGDEWSERLKVIRKKPEFEEDEIRLAAVVPSFNSYTRRTNSVFLHRLFKKSLHKDPVRFYLLDRTIGWFARHLERVFSASPLSDSRARLQSDAVLHPDLRFEGYVFPYADGINVAVEVKNHKNQLLFVEDVFIPHHTT